jgi:hypothetical protein
VSPAPTGNRPRGAANHAGLLVAAAAAAEAEASPASGARARGRTSRLTPGAWRRAVAAAARASLDAAERAIAGAEASGWGLSLSCGGGQ